MSELENKQVEIINEAFAILGTTAHRIAASKGWWDGERNDGELIALIHSELSECLEALRHENPNSEHIPEFSGAEEELADVLIRVFDMAYERRYRLASAVLAKMEFNAGRERKHGGKAF